MCTKRGASGMFENIILLIFDKKLIDFFCISAVSKVPTVIGPAMMLLAPIGSIMGWLFAEVLIGFPGSVAQV